MAMFIRNPSVEAIQYDGQNSADLMKLAASDDTAKVSVEGGLLSIFCANGDRWALDVGDYLVKDCGNLAVMTEKQFLAGYVPA